MFCSPSRAGRAKSSRLRSSGAGLPVKVGIKSERIIVGNGKTGQVLYEKRTFLYTSLHLSAPSLIMIQPSIRVRDGVHGS